MRTIIASLLCLSILPVHAEVPTDSDNDVLIATVLGRFDPELRTPPVPTGVAYRAIEAGEISGEAFRCNLRWIRHANTISAHARKLGMTDAQVAFVNALHDAKQSQMKSPLMFPCSGIDEMQARKHLDKSTKLGLEVPTIYEPR